MESTSFPSIAASDYRWHVSPDDPTLWQRNACGAETLAGMKGGNEHGQNDIFIAAELGIISSIGFEHIVKGAQRLWRSFRYKHPEVACSPAWGEDNSVLLTYKIPQNEQDVTQWIYKTIVVEESGRSYLELRQWIEENRAGFSEAAKIYIIRDKTSNTDHHNVPIMFHLNHLFFDGAGACLMVEDFFQDLATELGLPGDDFTTTSPISWEKSYENLSSAFVDYLDSVSLTSGPELNAAVQESIENMQSTSGSCGLKANPSEKSYVKILSHKFSQDDSQSICQSIKNSLGRDYTVTHLSQAAVFLATLRSNAPESPEAEKTMQFVSGFIAINDREYLVEEYGAGGKHFYGSCNTHGVLRVDNACEYISDSSTTETKIKELVEKMCRIVKIGYEKALSRNLRIPSAIITTEMLARMIRNNPWSTSSSTAPVFTSDGVYDRYISSNYRASQDSEPVFPVEDFHFFCNNYLSYPAIRLSSFRGQMRLCIDYNEAYYTEEYMRHLMEEIIMFMKILC